VTKMEQIRLWVLAGWTRRQMCDELCQDEGYVNKQIQKLVRQGRLQSQRLSENAEAAP